MTDLVEDEGDVRGDNQGHGRNSPVRNSALLIGWANVGAGLSTPAVMGNTSTPAAM